MSMRAIKIAIAIPAILLMGIIIYNLPPVHDRLAWRVEALISEIKYAINPPEQVVFNPQTPTPADAAGAAADAPSATPSPSPVPTSTFTPVGPTDTPSPSATPTLTPTPLPGQASLRGIIHEYQKWNNCGPANLSMALSYWKWSGNQLDTAAFLKPNPRDKNVMPYEMEAFVEEQTGYGAVVRVGGDLDTLKRFLAAGFPVIVEKGFEGEGFDGWMGHYEVLSGYNDSRERFIAQDSYIMANLPVPYDQMLSNWRAFNYTYVVVYPPEREAEVMELLGPHADETYNLQYAAQKASDEIYAFSGRDQYFAWYNRGSSLVALQDYTGAAAAYDEAFALYPSIPEKERPWRMVWYQTGPYFAYFYSQRYYDVLNLATTTLETANEPAIEESWYWRAMARSALGDTSGATADYRASLEWHPGFGPTLYQMQLLGVEP